VRRRIGITGHINLSSATKLLVAAELRRHLLALLREGAHAVGRATGPDKSGTPDTPGTPDLTGVSCLARGADSVFAEVLIELGGRLEVIVPSSDYRQVEVPPDHAPQFDLLLDRAESVKVMPSPTAGPEAYVAANNAMLDKVDLLLAVWDGDDGDEGGTGHVVNEARARQIPVTVIWPKGSRRT
jgi:hypothetical protein